MTLVSTPADRFADVQDYDYPVEHVTVPGAVSTASEEFGDERPEMAYVDVPGDGTETFLCLHGEPTWGFLYRGMVERLAERGRVVVPDFVGFGRSDKYTDREAYSFGLHYESVVTLLRELDLSGVTLVCQDWGGLVGLPAAVEHPERFARLVPMNTALPTAEWDMPPEWYRFHEFVESVEELDVARAVQNGTVRGLSDAAAAAYDAPFANEAEKAGAYAWPDLVPRPDGGDGHDVTAATRERLRGWEQPAFVLFSTDDPIMRPARDDLRDLIPTATDQPDVWVEDAGHFLQEDAPGEIADHIVDFVDRTG